MRDVTKAIKLKEVSDQTNVIDMNDHIELNPHWEHYCKHGLTMLMMYEATKDKRYLQRARLDYHQAKFTKDEELVRPLGCYLAA